MKLSYFMLGMILFGGVLDTALAQYEDSEDAAAEDSYGGGGGDGGYGGGGGGGYGGDGDEGYGGGGGGGGGADLSSHIDGVLDLDDKTWAKVIDGRHHVFVEFYEPECSECQDFSHELTMIGEELGAHNGLILAKVDGADSPELVKKFDVKSYPTTIYLAKGSLEKTVYEGESTSDAVIEFLTERAGGAGTVESLKALVDDFMTTTASRPATQTKMGAAVKKLAGVEASYGAYYLKVAKKVAEKGDDFAKTEFERLQRMIISGSLRTEKEAEFKLRCNVLRVFSREKLVNLKPADEEEEEEEEANDEL